MGGTSSGSELILYQTDDGQTKLQVKLEDESVWLTQDQMAELLQKAKSTINEHIRNVYADGELPESQSMRKFGKPEFAGKPTNYYSLDVIISVGYRVKSVRGTQFRIWATQRLREFIVKGFTMDDERQERIRDIRSSERRVYLRVREILALAADYEATEPQTQLFFQTIQNKLHFAATGKTAAELIAERADSSQPNMGLMAWHGGVVRKGDVTVAKNYLKRHICQAVNLCAH